MTWVRRPPPPSLPLPPATASAAPPNAADATASGGESSVNYSPVFSPTSSPPTTPTQHQPTAQQKYNFTENAALAAQAANADDGNAVTSTVDTAPGTATIFGLNSVFTATAAAATIPTVTGFFSTSPADPNLPTAMATVGAIPAPDAQLQPTPAAAVAVQNDARTAVGATNRSQLAIPASAPAAPRDGAAAGGASSTVAESKVTAEWEVNSGCWAAFRSNQVSAGRILTIAVDSATVPNLLLTVAGPGKTFRCKAWKRRDSLCKEDVKSAHPLGPDCWEGDACCWQTGVRFAPNGAEGNYSIQLCHAEGRGVVSQYPYVFEKNQKRTSVSGKGSASKRPRTTPHDAGLPEVDARQQTHSCASVSSTFPWGPCTHWPPGVPQYRGEGIVAPKPKAEDIAKRWVPQVTLRDFEHTGFYKVKATACLANYGMLKVTDAVDDRLADAIKELCDEGDGRGRRVQHELKDVHKEDKGLTEGQLKRYSVRLTSLSGRKTIKLPSYWCNCRSKERYAEAIAHSEQCGHQAGEEPTDAPTWYALETGDKLLMHEDEKMRTGEPKMQGNMPNKRQAAKLARLQARVLCAAHEVLRLLCAVWPESDTSGVAQAYGWSLPSRPPSVPPLFLPFATLARISLNHPCRTSFRSLLCVSRRARVTATGDAFKHARIEFTIVGNPTDNTVDQEWHRDADHAHQCTLAAPPVQLTVVFPVGADVSADAGTQFVGGSHLFTGSVESITDEGHLLDLKAGKGCWASERVFGMALTKRNALIFDDRLIHRGRAAPAGMSETRKLLYMTVRAPPESQRFYGDP